MVATRRLERLTSTESKPIDSVPSTTCAAAGDRLDGLKNELESVGTSETAPPIFGRTGGLRLQTPRFSTPRFSTK
jgi:hypothetical protein